MPAHMTATAWRQGCINALICGVGVVLCLAVLAVGVGYLFDQPPLQAMSIGFAVFWVAILLLVLATWGYGKAVAGAVLLDCGPHPTRFLYVILAIIWFIMAVPGANSGGVFGQGFVYAVPAFAISFAAYWLLMATGRLQIRENGIWQYWSLLRWNKIASYRWAEDGTLQLKAVGYFAFLRGALPVPKECQQAFDEYLASR